MEMLPRNLSFLWVWECLLIFPLPKLKRENISPKTFDSVFISYGQNSTAYRFMSLTEFSIYELGMQNSLSMFSLEKECLCCYARNYVHRNNASMSPSSFVIRGSTDELLVVF